MLDETDQAILAKRVLRRDGHSGPRLGDFIEMLDGSVRRFTHNWGDALQTTYICRPADASFYLSNDGFMSFSGSLDSTIPLAKIEVTEATRQGSAWFFHHDHMKAHNGVHVSVPCRVYRQLT